jgi:type II secretory pathway pseudopilin PulG
MLSRLLARRRFAAVDNDRGATLVELMVAMGLSTILGTITLLVFSTANTSVNATSDGLVDSAGARNVLQSWQGLIQTADAAPVTDSNGLSIGSCPTGTSAHRFEWLTSTETLFYADIANRSGTSITCGTPTLIWLGLRGGVLYEAHYSTNSSANYSLSLCRTLTDVSSGKVTAGSLFTPNPGQVLYSVDYGSAFAAASAFARVTSCSNMPTTVAIAGLKNTDATANNSLSQMTSVGIDFTMNDSTGTHSQTYDSTVAVLGGISS